MADIITPEDHVTRIKEQRLESLRWLQENYYDEFAEVYRAVKCRTEPIMVKNSAGKMVEDRTRTNVAMPDIAVAVRRGTARLTANPPQINYICANQTVSNKLTSWSYMQFDRSEEGPVQKLHIQQAKTFGFSATKSFWKTCEPMQTRRFQRSKLTDRAAKMKLLGSKKDDIDAAVTESGTMLSQDEIQADIQKNGPELVAKVPVRKYDGPATKFIFIGDYFPEPGFHPQGLKPAWEIEQYTENEAWLKRWKDETYIDDSGAEVPVFDPDAVKAMLETDSPQPDPAITTAGDSLRERLFAVSGITTPNLRRNPKLVSSKRFLVYECHEMVDGQMWIFWVGNENHLLGKMPYPWDLQGRSCYTQLVLLPDLIMGIGDSTPRLGRFLYRLHNAAVGQRTDLISNILRRNVFVQERETLPEPIERAGMRITYMKNVNDIKFQEEAEVPASAWTTESQVLKMFGMLDPNVTNTETGSDLTPGVGRTATAATLSAKSSDAMLQYELDGYNQYLRDLSEKKLWMLQQSMEEDITLPARYRQVGGGASAVPIAGVSLDAVDTQQPPSDDGSVLSPWDIQQNIDVEPEVGSTLSVDDEFRRMNAQNMYQLAVGSPTVWNVPECAKEYAKTIRGVDPAKVVLPPMPPPKPEPKISIAFTGKLEDMLTASQKEALVESFGLPADPQQMAVKDALGTISNSKDAVDAAGKLAEPAVMPPGGKVAT